MKKTDVLKTFCRKNYISRSVFGELQFTQIPFNFKTSCCCLRIKGLGVKLCVTFLLFLFLKELWRFKAKKSLTSFLLNKNVNFNKDEIKSKLENLTQSLRETNLELCFSSYMTRKPKVKQWWVGAIERKKRKLFVKFIFFEEKFFNSCVLSQDIVYWIHFQNIHALI